MATIALKEINQYIKNFYDKVGLRDLEAHHAERIREWLIDNLSNIGRYSRRDFERFGSLQSLGKSVYNDMRPHHFDRTDGIVALTEEVPDIDHLTFGTGALFLHGEMELPLWWENSDSAGKRRAGDHCYDDEYFHCNYSGSQKHIFQSVENDPPYKYWYVPISRPPPPGGWGDAGPSFGYNWADDPTENNRVVVGTFKPKKGSPAAFSEPNCWFYDTVCLSVGGVHIEEKQGDAPDGGNDDQIYHLGNERNHYPYRIVNSSAPKSVTKMLEKIENDKNGMYDGELPKMAQDVGTHPPISGHKFVKQGIEGIVDFISPLDKAPESKSYKKSKIYRDAFFFRNGIAVNHPETFPPNQIPPEERNKFYEDNLWNDQVLYDDDPDNDAEADLPFPGGV